MSKSHKNVGAICSFGMVSFIYNGIIYLHLVTKTRIYSGLFYSEFCLEVNK